MASAETRTHADRFVRDTRRETDPVGVHLEVFDANFGRGRKPIRNDRRTCLTKEFLPRRIIGIQHSNTGLIDRK
jgi:hypothetical protein